MANNNVLYISYDGMTDPLGQSQVIPYLEGLSKAGYSIWLISCEKKDRYIQNRKKIEDLLKKSSIQWHPQIYHKSPPVFSTLYDLLLIYRNAVKLHRLHTFSIIHCRSYPASIIGLRLKKKFKIPFIFDMRGLWADERVDGKLWNLNNPLYKKIYGYFKSLEKKFVQESAHIISLTNAGKKEIETWEAYKATNVPISVIPCSCDFDLYKKTGEEEIDHVKNELKIETDSFVLSYIGSLGTWYMLDEMLDFFKLLLQQKNNAATFLVLTQDDPEQVYQKALSKKIDREKIRVLYSSKDKLARYVSISDYSIFFITPLYSKIASSPTKLGELLSMTVPVITNSGVGDVDEILKITNSGIVIHTFNETEYLQAIAKINNVKYDMKIARDKARNIFSLNHAIETYISVYNEISPLQK